MHLPTLQSRLAQRHQPNITELSARTAHFAALHRATSAILVLAWFRLHCMIQRLDRLAFRWEQAASLRPGPHRRHADHPPR